MSLALKIAKNIIYQVTSKIIGVIIGLAVVGLMTRYLGQTGFGYYTTVIAFLQFFGVLADFGLQMTTNRLLAQPQANQQKIFANVLALRFFSALLFLGAAVLIGWLSPYPLIIKLGISVISFSFWAISLQSVFVSIFQNNLAMAKVAGAEIINRLVLLLGTYLVITFNQGLLYLLLIIVISNALNLLLLFFAARKYFPIRLAFDQKEWQEIWSTTWPLAITIALTLIYFRADTIILSLFRPASEVGLYGAPYKILEVLIQLPYLFLGLVLPLLSKFFLTDKKIFNLIWQKSFDLMIILTIPLILSILILGEKIMIFIAGPEFALSGNILRILILATGTIYLSSLFGYVIVACGLQKKMIKFYLFDAIASLILYLIFIPLYSYWAAATLTVLTEIIIALAAFLVLRKNLKLDLNLKVAAKALLAGLIMALVLLVLFSANLLILILVGALVYFAFLYLLRGISSKTIWELISFKK